MVDSGFRANGKSLFVDILYASAGLTPHGLLLRAGAAIWFQLTGTKTGSSVNGEIRNCQPHRKRKRRGKVTERWRKLLIGLILCKSVIVVVVVSLRLGLDICVPHQCQYSSPVDARGLQSFVCRKASGQVGEAPRPNPLDVLPQPEPRWQKKPTVLFRTDGKTPDWVMVWHSFHGRAASLYPGT